MWNENETCRQKFLKIISNIKTSFANKFEYSEKTDGFF